MSRKQILEILAPPIAFHRCLVRVTGSVNAALMLSQALYWTPRTRDPEGWFYKSQKDWEEETGLSRSEQEIARKQLKASGFWEERLRGVPATLYFCVDCEILQSRLLDFSILVCRKPANQIADSRNLSQRLPETTTKEALAAPRSKSTLVRKDRNGNFYLLSTDGVRTIIGPAEAAEYGYTEVTSKG